VGIGAAAGTPVRAVEAGTVEMAAPFEGYGPTVVVSHGGGYYSLYLYLRDVQVRAGTQITKGQVIGTVGGEGTPEGAHVEFQIREPGGGAVDPITWLRARG
jgi:murein DD-endopeptidase MepM/ murein hydrolase activator NlpD